MERKLSKRFGLIIKLVAFMAILHQTAAHIAQRNNVYQYPQDLRRDDERNLNSSPETESGQVLTLPKFNNSTSMGTQTQHIYRHIQTGSATIPFRGARINVGPDHNRTKTHVVRFDTVDVDISQRQRQPQFRRQRGGMPNKPRSAALITSSKQCVKCPPEKTVIAQKTLDGVLIELPPVHTCNNQQLPSSQYEIVTLFSNKFPFVLTHGMHTFIGRILNKKSNQFEHTCFLKYKVIVRQCGRYHPKNKDLKVKCDMASIWGSKCTFSCKGKSGFLSHNEPVICSDSMSWVGDEPTCFYSNDYAFDSDGQINSNSCELPLPPRNAKFSCDTNHIVNGNTNDLNDDMNTPNGSICYIKCNKHFEIPPYLKHYSIFGCENGLWNSTMMEFCHKIKRKNIN